MKETFNAVSEIREHHIHIYFEPGTESAAQARILAGEIEKRFPAAVISAAEIGLIGPHTRPNHAIHIAAGAFGAVVPWVQINSGGLSILIHPDRGDDLKDHIGPSMWLGNPVPYNERFFNHLRAKASVPGA